MEDPKEHPTFGPWALVSLIVLGLCIVGLVLAAQSTGWIGAAGFAGLIFLSAAMVGAMLGFIFAVPRVIATAGGADGVSGTGPKLLGSNTNLERISDWLATMLVGVGLSQLGNLNTYLLRFRTFLEETATVYREGAEASARVLPAVGPMVLILGAVTGFLLMYLMTRLVLVHFFSDSERMLSGLPLAAIRHAAAGRTAGESLVSSPDKSRRAEEDGSLASIRAAEKSHQVLLHAAGATTLSTDQAVEVMYELLQAPGGYLRVIQMSGELSRTAITRRADYWFYLACAFGQKIKIGVSDPNDLASDRDNAIDCAQRAVRYDKSFRARLRTASDPSVPDSPLSALHGDREFRALIGST